MSDDTNRTDDETGNGGDDARAKKDRENWRQYPDRLLEQGRERGLSRADREFLASGGDSVNSEQMAVNTRTRIRKRIRASIVDFWLLTEYLDDHDRDLVFQEQKDDWDNWELQIGLKSAIQFFYTALGETDLTDFETVLTSAIHDAEHKRRDKPALVDVDFDVEVDERFRVQDAYDKFERGVPLSPREIGALLLTGTVHDPAEIQRLSYHARANSFIEHALTPLLSEQLSSISDEEERIERFRYHWSHLPHEYAPMEAGVDLPRRSDFYYLEEELEFQQSKNEDVASEDSADGEPVEIVQHGREAILREMSADLDQPITVGDEVVYEDGDKHQIEQEEESDDSD